VFDWVIALDFASMYPSIIVSHNISPETMTQDTSDVFVIDDVNFKKKPLGIVPKLIQRFLNHRKSIKQQMQNVDKMSEEYKMLNLIDYALKQMIASVYGTFAFTGSRLYYPAVAKSITFLGRKYTKDVIAYIERTGKKVLYGDTDSILVQVGPNVIEEGKRLETQINDWLKTQGATPEIEFEIAYRKLLFSGAKKRYAGRCIYYKGKKTDELIVKGFESKRSDSALNSRECQDTLLRLILWGRTEKEIRDYIKSVAQNITSQSLQEIGIPQPLRQHPEMYANQASILGVIYANKILNYGFGIDDRPLIVWIKSVPSHLPKRIQLATKDKSGKRRLKWYDVNRVALRDERDFQFWKSHIDWKVQREKILEMKIEKILSSYGISFSEIMNGHKQKTLEDFNSLCSGQ
jgi:DNA polymerase elongation subunit (family B)